MTRQGVVAVLAGLFALAVGRFFGVVELFVIGAAFLVAVAVGLLYVTVRTPRLSGVRWIHPQVLVAGDSGRVDLQLHHDGAVRSAHFVLLEQVARGKTTPRTALLHVEPMGARTDASAGYRLPTSQRGVIHLGPLAAEVRDPLGVARRTTAVAGIDRVTVAPRAHPLSMPALGTGPLGRQLLASTRRLGPGEFHALREYATGDEPRSIHWKASARSDDLFVKEYAGEGIRRLLVVFDADPGSYVDADSFERGVTAAASIVTSGAASGLTTRFVTGGGVDLRGPDVAEACLKLLAEITPTTSPFGQLDRSPGEGIGLLVVISGSTRSSGWRAVSAMIDPTLTSVAVTTDEAASGPTATSARTEDEFLRGWQALTGRATTHAATASDDVRRNGAASPSAGLAGTGPASA